MPATNNSHFTFQLEGITIHASNLVFEQFTDSIPAHSHGANCFEIHYIPTGYGILHSNDRDYDITPNTLYVTGPFVEHSQTPHPENPMQEYCVYFRLDKSVSAKTNTPILNAFTSKHFYFCQDTQNIVLLLRNLFSELFQRSIGYERQIELYLAQLIILLVRNYHNIPTVPSGQIHFGDTENKTLLIEEYFLYEYKNLTLNDLAKRLALSSRQTQRLLLQYYNKTFQQKKTESRMSAAAILLLDKEKSITSISDMLGYSSPEYFSNAFKSYYKKSPREYRNQLFT